MLDLLTVEEVARELRVSAMTVYRLIHAKELQAVRAGTGRAAYRIERQELDRFVDVRGT